MATGHKPATTLTLEEEWVEHIATLPAHLRHRLFKRELELHDAWVNARITWDEIVDELTDN